ncbi:MAG: hypothetical protein QOJ60_3124 [Actinomycetota bacterium]|jgi:DNA-binding MarR family transcriptional regulator|nr:hypothetical protein [Actinomycetota bacterium]
MTVVKGESKIAEIAPRRRHIAELSGHLVGKIRESLYAEDRDGLRISHFRLLDNVPAGGISITELAGALGMTKQGCGQFVRGLETTGHVEVRPDVADRRTRLVFRTEAGDRVLAGVRRRIARIEGRMAETVGQRRYDQFRRTLQDLLSADF